MVCSNVLLVLYIQYILVYNSVSTEEAILLLSVVQKVEGWRAKRQSPPPKKTPTTYVHIQFRYLGLILWDNFYD